MAADPTAWAQARALAVDEGLTYAQVSERTGIPVSTIQKRASAENWRDARKGSLDYIEGFRALKRRLLKQLLETEGPVNVQDARGLRELEASFPEHRYGDKAVVTPAQKLEVAGDAVEAIVAHLGDVDPWLLGKIRPHLDAIGKLLEARYLDGA